VIETRNIAAEMLNRRIIVGQAVSFPYFPSFILGLMNRNSDGQANQIAIRLRCWPRYGKNGLTGRSALPKEICRLLRFGTASRATGRFDFAGVIKGCNLPRPKTVFSGRLP
jgi:hypothetical protein